MNDSMERFITKSSGRHWLIYLGIITIFTVALGYFACELNKLQYMHKVPIYDSMAYTNLLARIMQTSRQDGIIRAIRESLRSGTVVFPWLVSAIIGRFTAPSRMIGVWIQTGELLLLLWSLFYYLHRIRGIHHTLSFAFLLPFASFAGLYESNGGLSDFRMDVALFFWFALAVVWYLSASQSSKMIHWGVFGATCGIACLNRATALVYLVISFVPPLIADLAATPKRSRRLKQLVCAAVMAGISSGWFYIVRFDHLYYYYAIWNVDATAHLPIGIAVRHFIFALRFIGKPLLIVMICWNIVMLICCNSFWKTQFRFSIWSLLNWKLLYIGLAPAGFLMLQGAGLNPFVAMPSAFGLLLFLLCPYTTFPRVEKLQKHSAIVMVAFLSLLIVSLSRGVASHTASPVGSMSALKQVVKVMMMDARQHQTSQIAYGVTFIRWTVDASIQNVLIYEFHGIPIDRGVVSVGNVRFSSPIRELHVAAPVEWENIEGASDPEKLARIVAAVNAKLGYLILPTHQTALFLQDQMRHVKIHTFAAELRQNILDSGNWRPISEEIVLDDDEHVVVYRNQRL